MSDNFGSEWVKKQNPDIAMSKLGCEVAELINVVFKGIYHIPKSVETTDWSDNHCIEVKIHRPLATFDFSELTEIVILCHDKMLRCEISACRNGILSLMFHQRTSRTGRINERHPTIEEAITSIRKRTTKEETPK